MSTKRLIELDGLRGIAALAVVVFHYTYQYNNIYEHSFSILGVFVLGLYGVNLFFMISGFVIYWTISRTISPIDFIWSRASRLYPVYWAALTITFLVVSVFSLPGRERDLNTFFANLSMFHEYLGYTHIDGVYWTLTLELAFYVWIVIIFSIGQIKNIEKILIIWVVIASFVSIEKLNVVFDPRFTKMFLLDYIEFFAAGVCFYSYRGKMHTMWTHLLFIITILAVCVGFPTKMSVLFLSFYFVFYLVITNRAGFLRNKVILYIGGISYSLYLVHQNIGYIIINKFYQYNIDPLLGISSAILISIILAHLLTRYIERPSLKYLRSYHKNFKKIS